MRLGEAFHLNGENKNLDLARAPVLKSFTASTLKSKDADVHYCLLEVPVAQAVAMLPQGVHPGIPGIIATLHYHCPDSEIGPFDLLTTALFCRSAAKHRMMTLSAFTSSPKALEFFREGWGYPMELADVRLVVNYDKVRSVVSRDGTMLLDVATHDPIPLTGPGASVRYAQTLNLAHTPQGLKLVQVDASYEFKHNARGVPKFETYDRAALHDPHPHAVFPVSGTLAKADVAFEPVRFVADPHIPAEAGGVNPVADAAKAA